MQMPSRVDIGRYVANIVNDGFGFTFCHQRDTYIEARN